MKFFLIWGIKAYWFLIPPQKRNKCLFKQSCSQYVYNIAIKEGGLKGVKALAYRYTHCRPGYDIIKEKNVKLLISAKNGVFTSNEIKDQILKDE
jgi:putative component of membrane protein insertase Oxa1/YidC/SpoIIIJ protein YidD